MTYWDWDLSPVTGDAGDVTGLVLSLRENRDTREIEHRIVRKNTGEIRHVREKCEHFRDVDGRIVRSVGMVHDVTEQKMREEERLRLYNRLQETQRRVSCAKSLL